MIKRLFSIRFSNFLRHSTCACLLRDGLVQAPLKTRISTKLTKRIYSSNLNAFSRINSLITMSDLEKKLQLLKDHVNEYPDFPKPGVLFRDIFSIFQEPKVAAVLHEVMLVYAKNVSPPVDCVAALDARGFLLGPLIALHLKIPFVPIRKKGKLPGKVVSASYEKEYGKDTLEMQAGNIKAGQRVLIVDDLLATGGSLGAACELVEKLGARVATCLVLMELSELKGREKVPAEIVTVLKY